MQNHSSGGGAAPHSPRCELISWHQVQKLTLRSAQDIAKTGFKADVVIAIARGGFVPARLLCDYLDRVELASIRVVHYTAGAQMTDQARIVAPLNVDVRGKTVLVVDDVSDTGETLVLAQDYIAGFGPADIKTVVVHHKQVSRFTPDFYGQKVVDWRWLIYPWAVVEDLSGFLAQMSPRPTDVAAAADQLEKQLGVRVGKRTLDYIFERSAL